jgi:hypothetical protein
VDAVVQERHADHLAVAVVQSHLPR